MARRAPLICQSSRRNKTFAAAERYLAVLRTAFGMAVVIIAGVLVVVPTLAHGTFFGPYDILQSTGLNKVPNVQVHNATLFDQISLFIPWDNLVWTQVHQGHLPCGTRTASSACRSPSTGSRLR